MEPEQTLLPFDTLPGEDTCITAAPISPAPAAPSAQREAFLRERLLAKARAGRSQQLGHQLITAAQGLWQEPSPGVRFKLLYATDFGQSILLELAAGTSYIQSVAATHQECLVLRGDIRLGPSYLHAGDYIFVPHNDAGDPWLSTTGAQLFLHFGFFRPSTDMVETTGSQPAVDCGPQGPVRCN